MFAVLKPAVVPNDTLIVLRSALNDNVAIPVLAWLAVTTFAEPKLILIVSLASSPAVMINSSLPVAVLSENTTLPNGKLISVLPFQASVLAPKM